MNFEVQESLAELIPINANCILHIGKCAEEFPANYRRRNPNFKIIHMLDESSPSQTPIGNSEVILNGNLDDDGTFELLHKTFGASMPDVIIIAEQLMGWMRPFKIMRNILRLSASTATVLVSIRNPLYVKRLAAALSGDEYSSVKDQRSAKTVFSISSLIEILSRSGWKNIERKRIKDSSGIPSELEAHLIPLSENLGADYTKIKENLLTQHWLLRGEKGTGADLTVAALGLRKVGGVTEARVDFPLRALNSLNHTKAVWSSEGLKIQAHQKPGVLLLHRQFMNDPKFNHQMQVLAKMGWILVADMDDDPRHWKQHKDVDFFAFRSVHAVTVSTPKIAALIEQWNPNVAVFPNAIFEISPDFKIYKPGNKIRIFFGAINRERDWLPLIKVLKGVFLQLATHIEIIVIHDHKFYEMLPNECDKTFYKLLPVDKYLSALASSDIALLPLNNTEFNSYKSDLKFIESCGSGVVPICSETVYSHRVEHREIGFFAKTPEDWGTHLLRLVKDTELLKSRQLMGIEYVKKHRLHSHQSKIRREYFLSLLGNRIKLERDRQERLKYCRTDLFSN